MQEGKSLFQEAARWDGEKSQPCFPKAEKMMVFKEFEKELYMQRERAYAVLRSGKGG